MKMIFFNLTVIVLLTINTAQAQPYGCTDPLAINYNQIATNNDGSCIYSASSVIPATSISLVSTLAETSGMVRWNKQLWTHNDNEDINIYALDTLNGNITWSYPLTGAVNKDWEEISQDEDYIYIGDFGNNANGNRTDLKILRISKTAILDERLSVEVINFSYSDQTDFAPTGSNKTDFDCEAFIISTDSIYLFTKQWVTGKTATYSLPKTPGTHVAKKGLTFNVNGLVTGAVSLDGKKLVVLCGYSTQLEPFIYLLYDFKGYDFFSGNKRKINVSLAYHQVEGIATTDGLKYYISNENFVYPPLLNIPQKLHVVNLNSYLKDYLGSVSTTIAKTETRDTYTLYPVPANDIIFVRRGDKLQQEEFYLINSTGRIVLAGILAESENRIDISNLPSGLYILKIANKKDQYYKVIKR